jgi:peptidoglycan/LPS O-acetylase OafA/YrhL
LIAIGFGTFLISAISPELALSRVPIPGAAFFATVAYSIYLSHKLAIHWIEGVCTAHSIPLTSIPTLLILFAAITLLGAILFFAVERPFLQLRQRRIGTRSDPTR